jgi:hypothetical protein
MKKTLGLLLSFWMILMVCNSSLAAVHNFTGDFDSFYLMDEYYYHDGPKFEGWLSIDKNEPSATVRSAFHSGSTIFGTEYFPNDQTFVNLMYIGSDYNNHLKGTYLKGSYLFDNNLFV